jgi:hypothetical protein
LKTSSETDDVQEPFDPECSDVSAGSKDAPIESTSFPPQNLDIVLQLGSIIFFEFVSWKLVFSIYEIAETEGCANKFGKPILFFVP